MSPSCVRYLLADECHIGRAGKRLRVDSGDIEIDAELAT